MSLGLHGAGSRLAPERGTSGSKIHRGARRRCCTDRLAGRPGGRRPADCIRRRLGLWSGPRRARNGLATSAVRRGACTSYGCRRFSGRFWRVDLRLERPAAGTMVAAAGMVRSGDERGAGRSWFRIRCPLGVPTGAAPRSGGCGAGTGAGGLSAFFTCRCPATGSRPCASCKSRRDPGVRPVRHRDSPGIAAFGGNPLWRLGRTRGLRRPRCRNPLQIVCGPGRGWKEYL